jgi:hypothetical protein
MNTVCCPSDHDADTVAELVRIVHEYTENCRQTMALWTDLAYLIDDLADLQLHQSRRYG